MISPNPTRPLGEGGGVASIEYSIWLLFGGYQVCLCVFYLMRVPRPPWHDQPWTKAKNVPTTLQPYQHWYIDSVSECGWYTEAYLSKQIRGLLAYSPTLPMAPDSLFHGGFRNILTPPPFCTSIQSMWHLCHAWWRKKLPKYSCKYFS